MTDHSAKAANSQASNNVFTQSEQELGPEQFAHRTAPYYMLFARAMNNPNLSPRALKLFGFITGLCQQEGYCWATNDRLAKMMGSTPRSIQRFLAELVSYDLIDVDLKIGSRGTYRHITVPLLQQMLGDDTAVVGGRHGCRGGTTRLSPPLIRRNKMKEEKREREKAQSAQPSPRTVAQSKSTDDRKTFLGTVNVKMTKTELDQLLADYDRDTLKDAAKAVDSHYRGEEPSKGYADAMRRWIERDKRWAKRK